MVNCSTGECAAQCAASARSVQREQPAVSQCTLTQPAAQDARSLAHVVHKACRYLALMTLQPLDHTCETAIMWGASLAKFCIESSTTAAGAACTGLSACDSSEECRHGAGRRQRQRATASSCSSCSKTRLGTRAGLSDCRRHPQMLQMVIEFHFPTACCRAGTQATPSLERPVWSGAQRWRLQMVQWPATKLCSANRGINRGITAPELRTGVRKDHSRRLIAWIINIVPFETPSFSPFLCNRPSSSQRVPLS